MRRILGPHVLNIFGGENRPVADFFAELGKLLLMFFAGLEIDVARFRQARRKTMIFGLLTTSPPLLLGTWSASLGYGLIAAMVLGPCLRRTRCSDLQLFAVSARMDWSR